MTQRIHNRIHVQESIARAERLRRAYLEGQYTDEFTGEGVLVQVDGQLCIRPLTGEEIKQRALATLRRVPRCLSDSSKQ